MSTHEKRSTIRRLLKWALGCALALALIGAAAISGPRAAQQLPPEYSVANGPGGGSGNGGG